MNINRMEIQGELIGTIIMKSSRWLLIGDSYVKNKKNLTSLVSCKRLINARTCPIQIWALACNWA